MKDRLALLLMGLVCSILAWAFWRYFGTEASNILGLVVTLSLVVENRALRAKLREQENRARE